MHLSVLYCTAPLFLSTVLYYYILLFIILIISTLLRLLHFTLFLFYYSLSYCIVIVKQFELTNKFSLPSFTVGLLLPVHPTFKNVHTERDVFVRFLSSLFSGNVEHLFSLRFQSALLTWNLNCHFSRPSFRVTARNW